MNEIKLTPNQYVLLSIMNILEGIYGKTRIQKIIFLVQQEIIGTDIFSFRAHHYGPFSKSLAICFEELIELKLLDIKENKQREIDHYIITKDGRNKILNIDISIENKSLIKYLNVLDNVIKRNSEIIRQWNFESSKKLLKKVYQEYPDFTGNSLIRDEVLKFN